MRNLFLVLALLFAALSIQAQTVRNSCKWDEEVKKKCKHDLKPFHYYAFKITKITFNSESQFKEVEVPLFHDANYRFVFNTEGLHQDVKIEIYDKPASNSSRRKVYDGSSNERHFVYDPPKNVAHNRIYIDYIIPASNNSDASVIDKGCVIFYSGFKN
ncbi:MAG: hypothetical protein OSB25_08885 [Salibacteraceae bacterium]|nr:hypothetical protein [Salibacteraceae bacterium]|tara:strand:+ start:34370 stop:34843 length:474 start_codon:yes stop_codon:yes gene_type:complete